jgi:2-polyprenyl-3-methyl-5-hydroxy-6-metoxy-1,4-benzoquinol methylase
VSGFDGGEYQRRFDALAAGGMDVHGEATFVRSLLADPASGSVLDAGCGTGRVAIELARHGITTLGVDADQSMIAEARRRAPALEWLEADLSELPTALGPEASFTVVVLAGNVPLFTPPGTEDALVRGCAARVAPGGALVAGFQLGRGYELAAYDASCASAGVEPEDRYATWDRAPFRARDYAVSVHRRP